MGSVTSQPTKLLTWIVCVAVTLCCCRFNLGAILGPSPASAATVSAAPADHGGRSACHGHSGTTESPAAPCDDENEPCQEDCCGQHQLKILDTVEVQPPPLLVAWITIPLVDLLGLRNEPSGFVLTGAAAPPPIRAMSLLRLHCALII